VIDDPHERASAIVDAVIRMVCADASVFRALLANWKQSALMVDHDPTGELVACLREAQRDGLISAGTDPRQHAQLISAGLIGIVHQWGAGLIGDRALHGRGRYLVDVVFGSSRSDGC
jgi:uncharacterized protein YcfJ